MSYQICKRCIMDNESDDTILFDEHGICNYCKSAEVNMAANYLNNEQGMYMLKKLAADLKNRNKAKKYDCIMGLSGGIDSSYLLYLGFKLGLRVLVVHVDDGYDTEVSKSNIEKLRKACGSCDFFEHKCDKEQYNDLNLSFIKAGVPNIAIPQDNLIFSYIYGYAEAYGIDTFLSGYNLSTESILQADKTYTTNDTVHIGDINMTFGTTEITGLKLMSLNQQDIYNKVLNIKIASPLNYVNYKMNDALLELGKFCGFEYYGSKHHENIWTRFLQCYYFPKRFNVDKRKSHLSSMIMSDQISRTEALKLMERPIYDEELRIADTNLIAKEMGITPQYLLNLIDQPAKEHSDYLMSSYNLIALGAYYLKLDKFKEINRENDKTENPAIFKTIDYIVENTKNESLEMFVFNVMRLLNIVGKNINRSTVFFISSKGCSKEKSDLLSKYGAIIGIYDPQIKDNLEFLKNGVIFKNFDKVSLDKADIIIVDEIHDKYDYNFIQKHSRLIYDTCGALKSVNNNMNVFCEA